MAEVSISDKQFLAKILFTREHLEQKAIAKRVGVSENTISKWVNDFNWKSLRNRLLIGKEELLTNMYEEMAELDAAIKAKPVGKRYADTKQADIRVKNATAIRSLETELAIADLVESGRRFIKHMQAVGTMQQVMDVAEFWNGFIQASIKKT